MSISISRIKSAERRLILTQYRQLRHLAEAFPLYGDRISFISDSELNRKPVHEARKVVADALAHFNRL